MSGSQIQGVWFKAPKIRMLKRVESFQSRV